MLRLTGEAQLRPAALRDGAVANGSLAIGRGAAAGRTDNSVFGMASPGAAPNGTSLAGNQIAERLARRRLPPAGTPMFGIRNIQSSDRMRRPTPLESTREIPRIAGTLIPQRAG
jgi:hypothetical protein